MVDKFADLTTHYKASTSSYSRHGNDSIVYDWSSSNAFWERIRQNALGEVSLSKILFDENNQELATLGARVKAQGEAELKKEQDLLKHMMPEFDFSGVRDIELIQKLNEIIRGKEQYQNALNRIKAAINNSDKTGNKNLGPSVSSLFTSYLGTEISNIFYGFVSVADAKTPFSAWTAYFESHLNDAIDKAVERMLEEIGTNDNEVNPIYGDADQWRELGEAYRNIQGFAAQFQNMIRNKIKFDRVANMFSETENQKIYRKARRGSSKSGFRTYVDRSLNLRTRAGQVGGSVNEYLQDLFEHLMPKLVTIMDHGSAVIGSEQTSIDRVVAYQFEAEVQYNAQQIADEINNSLFDAHSLKESAQILEEFYNNNLAQLSNTFIEYTSDKMYKLDQNFSGFHNGSTQLLSHLPDYIDAAGIDASIGMDFVYTAYNTLDTAIYAGERTEIQNEITNILTAAAAKLLFNDWSTVGVANPGAQVFHVLNLDGILMPSSYILINLGNAMIEASADVRQFFAVNVSLPTTVVYHKGDWKGWPRGDIGIKNQLAEQWNKQFSIAEKESYFSVKFLSNFKGIMGQLLI